MLQIDENLDIEIIKLSDTRALRVSLLRSKGNRYTAVTRLYKARNADVWKPQRAIWILFANTSQIAESLAHAYQKGLNIGWGEPPRMASDKSPQQSDIQTAVTDTQKALDRVKDCLKEPVREEPLEQSSLLKKLKNLFQPK